MKEEKGRSTAVLFLTTSSLSCSLLKGLWTDIDVENKRASYMHWHILHIYSLWQQEKVEQMYIMFLYGLAETLTQILIDTDNRQVCLFICTCCILGQQSSPSIIFPLVWHNSNIWSCSCCPTQQYLNLSNPVNTTSLAWFWYFWHDDFSPFIRSFFFNNAAVCFLDEMM